MVLRIKRNKDRTLTGCGLIAALLCVGQVLGSAPVLLACLLCFLMFVAVTAYWGIASPVLMFFLPWAPLLKIAPGTVSFYTFALIIVCGITFWKKRFPLNIYCTGLALLLVAITLLSKGVSGYGLSADYILFLFFLFLFPVMMSELREKVNFTGLTVFFSVGIISAALSAQWLVSFPQIARYIDVYSWNVVTRLSGYYGDANFYSTHISAALSGVLVIFLREGKSGQRNLMVLLGVGLLYCGFLSASKTFFVVIAVVLIFWFLKLLFMRGKVTRKLTILAGFAIVAVAIIASGVFAEQWEAIVFRFNQATSLSSLTTGRTDLWLAYLKELWGDLKLLLLGRGFTNVLVDGRASHNTLIQIVYQFGIPGGLLLLVWEYYFMRGVLKYHGVRISMLDAAVLLAGVFLPWMSLDLVFFDEFYLMPLYAVAGLIYTGKNPAGNRSQVIQDPGR